LGEARNEDYVINWILLITILCGWVVPLVWYFIDKAKTNQRIDKIIQAGTAVETWADENFKALQKHNNSVAEVLKLIATRAEEDDEKWKTVGKDLELLDRKFTDAINEVMK